MARSLKPQKVEDFRHNKRGVSVALFLDRNTHEFFFDFLQERYTKPSLAELHKLAYEVIERETALTWAPMITVEKLTPFVQSDQTFIGFTIDRSWIARKANGNWLESQWDTRENGDTMHDRETWASNFYIGRNVKFDRLPYYGESKYYLPYSEALWTGLEKLLHHIRAMKRTLNHLLTTPDGLQRVEQAAGRALPGMLGLPNGEPNDDDREEAK